MQPASFIRCTIASTQQLTPAVKEVRFETDRPLHYRAGQWIHVREPATGLSRPYSVASPPSEKPHKLCIKIVRDGPMSRFWEAVQPGDAFEASEGSGTLVYHPPGSRNVCFVVMGTGIAPIRAIVRSEEFRRSAPEASLCIFGALNESEMIYCEDFQSLRGMKWLPVLHSPTATWEGEIGVAAERLRKMGTEIAWQNTDFYLCGSLDFIKDVRLILQSKGVDENSIRV